MNTVKCALTTKLERPPRVSSGRPPRDCDHHHSKKKRIVDYEAKDLRRLNKLHQWKLGKEEVEKYFEVEAFVSGRFETF